MHSILIIDLPDVVTVKPVCNDHHYDKLYYLRFIKLCVLMMTGGTSLLEPPRWAPESREVSH